MTVHGPRRPRSGARPAWTAWRVVLLFGLVSLAADMVYEGARSLYGPLLASLGASAAIVGLVTGAGEAMALVLRLVFGPLADRSGRYWALTLIGYGLTVVSVPLLAVTPFAGAAGLGLASLLILLERSGKAIRSPSKSALLAHVAGAVGRGRGFGVHKAMDQLGAFAGPLLVAAVVASTGALWRGLFVLLVPGAAAMVLLVVVRARVPDPSVYDGSATAAEAAPPVARRRGAREWLGQALGAGLPPEFFRYAVAAGLMTGGLVTFGIIGYHLTVSRLVPVAVVPVVYAGAMLAEALAALAVGWAYDRISARVLYAVPVLVALVPGLALSGQLWVALVGVGVWGLAFGLQDSTIKAMVADLVAPSRRATAYGVFAGIQGAMAIVGGAGAGWLYERSVAALVAVVAASQAVALVLLVRTLRRVRQATR
ncbi:MAG TPA: MFS transporter [Intrasporangium sp.]|uniref:MFS transporter n=1 Tax=Intrasporangium sp. TaxID=1925024 RepID=UPI002D770662|nr:MFS transporter [Intrasporangium sp.]HET7398182.1 MFS transporter [Intrasporangium sp.]